MNKLYIVVFLLLIITVNPVMAHKLISHDESHKDFQTALHIPDHKISWAIYENLNANEAKFYTFEAKEGESLYAGIVVPKISGLEEYSPVLIFVDPLEENGEMNDFKIEKFLYEGDYPGKEFYEPFGQVTYWERQEVNVKIPHDGKYFLIVTDEKNQSGKYSLAIGTIEDFSGLDFITILPKAWFDTKIFVNDYTPILIFFAILSIVLFLIAIVIKRNFRKKKRGIV